MRIHGFAPSLGAAASPVAAVGVLSLLVMGVFGVRVWPDGPESRDGGAVTLPPGSRPVVAERPKAPVAGPRVPAARDEGAPSRGGRRDSAPRARRETAPRAAAPRATGPTTPAPGDSPASATTPPTDSPAAGTTPAAAAVRTPEAPRATATPAPAAPSTPQPGPIEQTVATVREIAEPVTTVLPAPVQTVVATVQETARTVDQTVQAVTDALKRKP